MWLVCVCREHIWQNKRHPWFVTAEEKRNGREKKTAYHHRREPSKLPWFGSIAPREQ